MVLLLLSKSHTFSYFNKRHKFTRPVARGHLSPNTQYFFLSRLKCYEFHVAVLGLHAYMRVCNVQLCCHVIRLCHTSHCAVKLSYNVHLFRYHCSCTVLKLLHWWRC